jgi:hypothetical protein
MPLAVRWSKFTYENLDRVDAVYGVYELGDKDRNIIYIGHGVLRDRLFAHKISDDPCFKKARYYRFEKTGSKESAEQKESAEINAYEQQHGELPECNKRREHPTKGLVEITHFTS